MLRYIHQNPQKAGAESFSWTSYAAYKTSDKNPLVDTEFALSLFPTKTAFLEFMKEDNDDKPTSCIERNKLLDEEAADLILAISGYGPENLHRLSYERLDIVLRELRTEGARIRQIERLTNVTRSRIQKAYTLAASAEKQVN